MKKIINLFGVLIFVSCLGLTGLITCGKDTPPLPDQIPTSAEIKQDLKEKSIRDLLPPDLLKNSLFVQMLESTIPLDALRELKALKRKDTAVIFQKMLYYDGREYEDSDEIRMFAIETLGEMKYIDGIEDLVNLLVDEDRKIRTASIRALVNIGDRKAQAYLRPLLKHQYMYVRRDVLYVLSEIADETIIPDVKPLLSDSEEQVRWQAMRIMVKFNERSVIPIIPKLFASSSGMDRQAAVMAFQQFKDISLIPVILEALKKEESVTIAWMIAVNLAEFKDNINADNLVPVLSQPGQVTLNVAWILGLMGDERSIPRLLDSLNTPNIDIRLHSIEALRKIGDKDTAIQLVRLIDDPNYVIREEIILTLGELGNKAVIPSIRPYLQEKSRLRKFVIRALGNLDDKEMASQIYEFLTDIKPIVRYYTCESLGKLKTNISSLKAIIKLLDDQTEVIVPDPEGRFKQSTVNEGAIFALEQLTGQVFKDENKEIIIQKWKQWWEENKNTLHWSDKNNIFQVNGTDH